MVTVVKAVPDGVSDGVSTHDCARSVRYSIGVGGVLVLNVVVRVLCKVKGSEMSAVNVTNGPCGDVGSTLVKGGCFDSMDD